MPLPTCPATARGTNISSSNRSSASDGRMRGRRLQEARAELFRRNPLCVNCERNVITRLATERDHIINLAEGRTDDPSNMQGLCKPCHQAKTHSESNRARGVTNRPSYIHRAVMRTVIHWTLIIHGIDRQAGGHTNSTTLPLGHRVLSHADKKFHIQTDSANGGCER